MRRAPLLVLFLTVFIDLLGFGIVIPFLPLFAERLHTGGAGVGMVLAAYSLMQFICAPLLGRLSDRVGRRPIIMVGLFGSAIGYLIYGFAWSFGVLLLSRIVHGACAATVSTAQAYVADTTAESQRAHGMGMIGAAFGLGFVLGPALGGLLGHASLRTPALFAAALSLANLVFAALALPESHVPDRASRLDLGAVAGRLMRLPRELRRGTPLRLFTLGFMVTFAFAALETTFAMMVPLRYGYGAFGVGALLAFAGTVQAVAQGYLVRRFVGRVGEAGLITAGIAMFAVGLAPLASLGSHGLLVAFLGLVSLGYGLSSPAIASLISKSVARELRGEALGTNQSALSLARIAGPVAGGLAYQLIGPAAPYLGGGAVALGALLLASGVALPGAAARE